MKKWETLEQPVQNRIVFYWTPPFKSQKFTEENVERLSESEVLEDSKGKKNFQSYQGIYIYIWAYSLWLHKDGFCRFVTNKDSTWSMENKTKMSSPLQGAIFTWYLVGNVKYIFSKRVIPCIWTPFQGRTHLKEKITNRKWILQFFALFFCEFFVYL